MAQSIFTHLVHRQHLDAVFEIDSAATSREEIGNPPHYGTKNKLYEEHIPLIPHRARQMTRDDYLYYDLLIGMDTANIRNMTRIAGGSDSQQKIFKMLSFADYGTNHKLTAARDSLIEAAAQMKEINDLNSQLLAQAIELTEFDITLFKSMKQAPETANYDRNAYNTGDILGSSGFDAKQ